MRNLFWRIVNLIFVSLKVVIEKSFIPLSALSGLLRQNVYWCYSCFLSTPIHMICTLIYGLTFYL